MSFSNVHFILFKPQLAENIGACARALKNFNFTKLKLVSPKISFPNEKVFATSVGAKDIINSSKIYSNFEDAIKDTNCVIATSSRIRKKNYKYLSINELKKIDFKFEGGIVEFVNYLDEKREKLQNKNGNDYTNKKSKGESFTADQ